MATPAAGAYEAMPAGRLMANAPVMPAVLGFVNPPSVNCAERMGWVQAEEAGRIGTSHLDLSGTSMRVGGQGDGNLIEHGSERPSDC